MGLIYLFAWLKWVLEGKPMIHYKGYWCGICGKYIDKPFCIPKYQSFGEWWDTWGICEECGLIDDEEAKEEESGVG